MNGEPSSSKSTGDIDILRARARRLAQPVEALDSNGELIEVLEFSLGLDTYALESRCVREVRPLLQLTPLPCVPRFLLGIVNVRGQVLPVIHFKRFVGMTEKGLEDLHNLIILEDGPLSVGFAADAIAGVRSISAASLQPAPAAVTGIPTDYVRGMTPLRLVLLNISEVLREPRLCVRYEVFK